MVYKNKQLCLLMWCLPLIIIAPSFVSAQDDKGIKWTIGLSWDQIKQKAKAENKYIFLDCFTTWCGPCKMMDKNVYVNDTVGDYFNDKFISVKVQMDKTKKDNDQVQQWYDDAEKIGKEYHIEAYPTFTFISPFGTVVQKETGFRGVNDFIALAQTAIKPGKTYDDPYAEYENLVLDYKQGTKHYDRMVYMIKAALTLDTTLSRQLIKDYIDYVSTLEPSKRYIKENIEFWSLFVHTSKSNIFQFFYKDGTKIDSVMSKKGYAAAVVDKTIFYEVLLPFLTQQNKNPMVQFEGNPMGGIGIIPDYAEADWKKLKKIIRQKYNSNVVNRNVVAAKKIWYERHWNAEAAVKITAIQFLKFPPSEDIFFQELNNISYDAFLISTEVKVLNQYITWMKTLIDRYPDIYFYLDTYANLLYKVGKRDEAIKWQEKAVNIIHAKQAPGVESYEVALEQMKKGQPTSPGQAKWDGVKSVKWGGVKFDKVIHVRSSGGEALAEVSIKIKNNDEAVLTKTNGLGIIKVSVGDVLLVSKNGFASQELIVNKSPAPFIVVLQELK